MKRRFRQSGFTLAEVLIASSILAFATVGITEMIVAGQMATYESLHEHRAQSLCEAMIEEIISLPYHDPDGSSTPGGESGETTRALFDNMDDYHGFSESAGSTADFDGTAYPASFANFSRSVSVTIDTENITGLNAITGITIVVTVTDHRNKTWTLTRFVPEPIS